MSVNMALNNTVSRASAVRALQLELKMLHQEPVDGFFVRPADESNLFQWEVGIFGSPGTLYEGGYFKALITFPQDYPYSPPTVKFLCKMWHPNIYENGEVCISILHPPVDDPQSGELPCERWNPTQSVRTVLLSIISLLNEPNTFSPANVDASIAFRKWKDTEGKEKAYEEIVRKQVLDTKLDAEKDGVSVPMTLQEYCVSSKPRMEQQASVEFDYYDDYSVDADDSDGAETVVTCTPSDVRNGESRHDNAGL